MSFSETICDFETKLSTLDIASPSFIVEAEELSPGIVRALLSLTKDNDFYTLMPFMLLAFNRKCTNLYSLEQKQPGILLELVEYAISTIDLGRVNYYLLSNLLVNSLTNSYLIKALSVDMRVSLLLHLMRSVDNYLYNNYLHDAYKKNEELSDDQNTWLLSVDSKLNSLDNREFTIQMRKVILGLLADSSLTFDVCLKSDDNFLYHLFNVCTEANCQPLNKFIIKTREEVKRASVSSIQVHNYYVSLMLKIDDYQAIGAYDQLMRMYKLYLDKGLLISCSLLQTYMDTHSTLRRCNSF